MLFLDMTLTKPLDSDHAFFLAFWETADVVPIWLLFTTLHFCLNQVCRWNFSLGSRMELNGEVMNIGEGVVIIVGRC